jgi:hypothetical protein
MLEILNASARHPRRTASSGGKYRADVPQAQAEQLFMNLWLETAPSS